MLKSWTTLCGVGTGGISPQLLGWVRGKEKLYLPHSRPTQGSESALCLRCAAPNLHPAMERYARLAMRELSGTKTSQ